MALFKDAYFFPSGNAVTGPQMLRNFDDYKGNPTSGGYRFPITCSAKGVSVFITNTEMPNFSVGKSNKVMINAGNQLVGGSFLNIDNAANFEAEPIVCNYTTQNFLTFAGQNATGTAYRLRKQPNRKSENQGYTPSFVLEKIGAWNDVVNNYDNLSVVLTGCTYWKDTGATTRVKVPTGGVYSISVIFGRRAYDVNGVYQKDSGSNQDTEGGYLLIKQGDVYSSSNATVNHWYGWYDLWIENGADIILFDTSAEDKTGQYASRGKLAIIFSSKTNVADLGNSIGLPFVVDNEQAAKTSDIKDLPDYIPPGVPENETGGGKGIGDNKSDTVDTPKVPGLSPLSGGSNLYCMTADELQKTFNFLLDGHNKDILGITVSEVNIVDSLCNCYYLPFDILSHDRGHCRAYEVGAGGYGSGIMSQVITEGYNRRFNFGDLEINEYYGSYLDYAPFTTITIYLPYIGYKPLDVSKVMGKKINVTYSVDFVLGMVTAYIAYYENENKQVFAEFTGQMGIPIKITGKNTSESERAVKDAALSVGAFVLAAGAVIATGGSALPIAVGAIGAGVNAVGKTITANITEPDSVTIGNAGAENWLISPQGCYVYIQRARTATPENFADINGWATRYTGLVSEFTGYLECSEVVNTVNTTAEEKNLITNLLKQGVYV